LFTYAGCGTLFTLTDYCRVEPLGLDDFYDAERLIQRGEQEGYLKSRTSQETSRLLLHSYGAWLGVAAGELAGFCALFPYPDDKAGEIVALYTITRFQGEGIGGRLVSRMIQEAKTAGLCYIFACTFQEGAQRLFERYGFQQVGPGAVPDTKWQDYDLARKEQIAIYRQDL
jgi:amino-acid N-acetyltransferase